MLELQNPYANIPELMLVWTIGMGPKEYGLYKMPISRKKLKGWQRELKCKNK